MNLHTHTHESPNVKGKLSKSELTKNVIRISKLFVENKMGIEMIRYRPFPI
jgi:hypothetical protein